MQYKYRYRFTVEGLNRQTNSLEEIHVIEQDRNTGIDHKIYKMLRTICFNAYDKHTSLMVSIVKWDLSYPEDSMERILSRTHVGMFFFDKYETFTRRAIIISRPDGTKPFWSVINWKD